MTPILTLIQNPQRTRTEVCGYKRVDILSIFPVGTHSSREAGDWVKDTFALFALCVFHLPDGTTRVGTTALEDLGMSAWGEATGDEYVAVVAPGTTCPFGE